MECPCWEYFITDQISLPVTDIRDWRGYHFTNSTGYPYIDTLLEISSPLPVNYANIMREQQGLKMIRGLPWCFQAIIKNSLKRRFVTSVVTGSQTKQSRSTYPDIVKVQGSKLRLLRVFLCIRLLINRKREISIINWLVRGGLIPGLTS